jgi:hypothetical protein
MALNLNIIESLKRGQQQSLVTSKHKLVQSGCTETLKQATEIVKQLCENVIKHI